MICNELVIDDGESNVDYADTQEKLSREGSRRRLTLRDWVSIKCHSRATYGISESACNGYPHFPHVSCVPGNTTADRGTLSGRTARKEFILRLSIIMTL